MAANPVAVRGNYVYLSNIGWPGGSPTGVLKYNQSTLAYVNNAIPLTVPNTAPTLGDIVFGPDGRLYVSTNTGISRYTQNVSTGALTLQAGFGIATPGIIAFRPGDSSIYVGSGGFANMTISQYDSTGAFVRTLLTTTSVSDFVFGDDGALYVAGYGVRRFDANKGALLGTIIEQPSWYLSTVRIDFVAVPEAGTVGMLGLGAGLLLKRKSAGIKRTSKEVRCCRLPGTSGTQLIGVTRD